MSLKISLKIYKKSKKGAGKKFFKKLETEFLTRMSYNRHKTRKNSKNRIKCSRKI